tara:strand:- start:86 stop:583 length:498 start_codon:yes stop_codon:yes gene_type:complete
MPNAYASKICAGKIKDPSGVKRKDFKGPKPAAKGAMMKAKKGDLMIVIGIGKKKKNENKKFNGIKANTGISVNKTAGSQSGKGRIEKSGLDMEAVKKIANKFKNMKKPSANKINKPQFQHEGDLPRAMRIDTTTSAYGNAGKGRKVPKFAEYNKGGMADYYKDLM